MSSKKNVYFNLRTSSRERMWDTVKHADNICNVLLPTKIQQHSSIKTFANSKTLVSKIKFELSKKIINRQNVDLNMVNNSDLIYMWGAFPKKTKIPYIVELDNPYSLAYYHVGNLYNNKDLIIQYLKNSYKISFMSEACMKHSFDIYGESLLLDKSYVLYPYVSPNYHKRILKQNNFIDFVFVGLNSRYKGAYEALEAFHSIKEENIRLTFISDISKDIRNNYNKDSRIIFLDPQPRDKLLNEIYPYMDVMLFPSFYESFGMVLLEAMSFGMGLIATNTYAVPEMIIDNFNGKILHHPIIRPSFLSKTSIVGCPDIRAENFYDKYLSGNEFYYGLYDELRLSILKGIEEYKQWQSNSIKLFNEKFAPSIWLQQFNKIINKG